MVDVAPFRALRYRDLGNLAEVTAPPYDAIDASFSERLHARSPYNIVRLELDAKGPLEASNSRRYETAAATYARWRRKGILALDEEPALYVYEQAYEHGGASERQRGLLVALRLQPWEAQVVLPHERVFPGPVEDRLRLLEALPVNTSPIYLLAEHEPEQVTSLLEAVTTTPPLAVFDDPDEGVGHKLWRVTDRDAHARVRVAYAGQRLLMADGHHRYTTALEYRSGQPPDKTAERGDRILAFVVGGEGPVVRPSHRLVGSLPADFEERLHTLGFVGVRVVPRLAPAVGAVIAALEDAPPPPGESRPAFGLLTRDWIGLVVIQHPERVAEVCATLPQALRGVDVALLQRVLNAALDIDDRSDQLGFTFDADQAAKEVAAGRAAGLFLVRPVPIAQVWTVAKAGLLLPPKSTSFFPKPRTGLVLRPLGE
ncbi:MAG: DUF1015 family protein [Nitriliruptorales bacterium]